MIVFGHPNSNWRLSNADSPAQLRSEKFSFAGLLCEGIAVEAIAIVTLATAWHSCLVRNIMGDRLNILEIETLNRARDREGLEHCPGMADTPLAALDTLWGAPGMDSCSVLSLRRFGCS